MWKIFPILALLIGGCSAESPPSSIPAARSSDPCSTDVVEPINVSLAALLANPERYEGRSVAVIGFLHQSLEHSAIYSHREDYVQTITPNGLWVSGATIPEALNDRYARVEGIFTTTETGHLNQWSGAICNIGRATPWGRDAP